MKINPIIIFLPASFILCLQVEGSPVTNSIIKDGKSFSIQRSQIKDVDFVPIQVQLTPERNGISKKESELEDVYFVPPPSRGDDDHVDQPGNSGEILKRPVGENLPSFSKDKLPTSTISSPHSNEDNLRSQVLFDKKESQRPPGVYKPPPTTHAYSADQTKPPKKLGIFHRMALWFRDNSAKAYHYFEALLSRWKKK